MAHRTLMGRRPECPTESRIYREFGSLDGLVREGSGGKAAKVEGEPRLLRLGLLPQRETRPQVAEPVLAAVHPLNEL